MFVCLLVGCLFVCVFVVVCLLNQRKSGIWHLLPPIEYQLASASGSESSSSTPATGHMQSLGGTTVKRFTVTFIVVIICFDSLLFSCCVFIVLMSFCFLMCVFLGWHYLSSPTCLMRHHSSCACFVVSRSTVICYIARHV